MTILFTNGAGTMTVNGLQPSDVSVNVTPGSGALFPTISLTGDYFIATLTNSASPPTVLEIVKVTARSADVLTIVRAQEGTAAQVWAAGSTLQNRLTAGSLVQFIQPAQAQAQGGNFGIDSGVLNAYVVTLSPVLATPVRGTPIRVLIGATNTGASTLSTGDGPRAIVKSNGAALTGGELAANGIYTFLWNGTSYQLGG